MNFQVTKKELQDNPTIETVLCSFTSTKYGTQSLKVVTNFITKEVTFKVIGSTNSGIFDTLDEALKVYNLINL